MRWAILIACAALLAQGCVTATPAFGGKTRAETTFIDADGTNYTRSVELPSGVELNGQDSMSLSITPEGGYDLNIGQQGAANTVAQAELQAQGIQAQAQMFASVANLVGAVAELAAPLIGQNLQLDAAQRQTDSANTFQLRSQLMGAVQQQMADPAFRDWLMEILTQPTPGAQLTVPEP